MYQNIANAYRCAQCGQFEHEAGKCPKCGAVLQAGAIQAVTAEELRAAIATSPVPVLVELHSSHCPHCRRAGDELRRVAAQERGHLVVLSADLDANPNLGREMETFLYPSFLLFRSGTEIGRSAGFEDRDELETWSHETPN